MQICCCKITIFKLLSCWNNLCGAPRYATMSSNVLSAACKWIALRSDYNLFSLSISRPWARCESTPHIHIYVHLVANAKKTNHFVMTQSSVPSMHLSGYFCCTLALLVDDMALVKYTNHARLTLYWNSQHFVVRSQLPRPSKLACRWWTRVNGHRSNLRRRPSEESDFLPKFLYASVFHGTVIFPLKRRKMKNFPAAVCALTKGVYYFLLGAFSHSFFKQAASLC